VGGGDAYKSPVGPRRHLKNQGSHSREGGSEECCNTEAFVQRATEVHVEVDIIM